MSRINVPFIAFNRGLVSKKALARIDLERTRLSAEIMTNWLPSTQGSMRLRPGTKYIGSSLNDTGAAWVEFVAAVDQTALLELTNKKMRIWQDDTLVSRPSISTVMTLADTGWYDVSEGGTASITTGENVLPKMTSATSGTLVIMTISSDKGSVAHPAWHASDAPGYDEPTDTGDYGHDSTPIAYYGWESRRDEEFGYK